MVGHIRCDYRLAILAELAACECRACRSCLRQLIGDGGISPFWLTLATKSIGRRGLLEWLPAYLLSEGGPPAGWVRWPTFLRWRDFAVTAYPRNREQAALDGPHVCGRARQTV